MQQGDNIIMNRKRPHSRSNEALLQSLATESPSILYTLPNELHQKQLFKQSFDKIQQIKSILMKSSSKQLMQELNDIIDLIKGQRVKAKFMIQQLGQIGKSVQQGQHILFQERGVNTDSILPGLQQAQQPTCKRDLFTQTETEEKADFKKNQVNINSKKYESYYKLVCMIDKLKVDYRKILPIIPNLPDKYILPDVDSNIGGYKVLKNQQILKLQSVFISKFNSMIQSQLNKLNQAKNQDKFMSKQLSCSTPQKIKSQNTTIEEKQILLQKRKASACESQQINRGNNKIQDYNQV